MRGWRAGYGLVGPASRRSDRGPAGRRSHRNRVAVAGCAVTLFALAGCAPPADPAAAAAPPPPVAVTVAPVAVRAVQRSVAAVGTLNGYDDVTLAPKVDGRVAVVRADVGDVAVPGTTLLELDPTDYRLAVAEAREALAAELAKLGLTELPPGDVNVEAVPAVRRAEVSLEDAARRLRMRKELFGKQAASKDEFELAETDLRLAEATKVQTVTEARAVVASARLRKAALDTAEQKLRDCKLTVPVPAGWAAWAAVTGPGFTPLRYAVAQRLVGEGEMVRAMPVTNAYRLVIDHVLKLRAAVPEQFEPEVRVGQACEVTVDAYPGRVFPGRVARKYPTIDPQSRTFQAEVAVPNAGGKLRCGGFAKAAILTRTDPAVTTVPPTAVVTFAGVNKVFVAAGDRAKAVEVGVGTRDRDWVEVTGDLPPGAQVVTSGQTQLVDGSEIRIRPTGTDK